MNHLNGLRRLRQSWEFWPQLSQRRASHSLLLSKGVYVTLESGRCIDESSLKEVNPKSDLSGFSSRAIPKVYCPWVTTYDMGCKKRKTMEERQK